MSVQAPAAQVRGGPVSARLPASGAVRRIFAHAIDLAAVAAVTAAVVLPTGSVLLGGVVAVEAALGLAVWEARSGRTLGKRLLGIRAAQLGVDYAPGLRRGMVRSALLGLSHALALVGQFLLIATSALDRTGRGQAWHDRAAGTRVVSIRADARRTAPVAQYAPGPAPAVVPQGQAAPGVLPPPASPWGQEPPGYAPPVSDPAGSAPEDAAQSAQPGPAQPPAAGTDPTGSAAGRGAPAHGASSSAPPGRPAPPPPEQSFTPPPMPAPPADGRTLDPSELPDLDAWREQAQQGAVFVLTVDDGTSATVSGTGLIGRRPQVGPAEQVAHLLAVDDPGRSLSRTHAAFGIDGEVLWVEDRGSANGTVVVGPDGTATRALPGQRIPVPEDGRIDAGERSITVQRWQAWG